MTELATVVVTPRERFSYAVRSLESLRAHTREPHRLLYVDGGSPRPVARRIAAICAAAGYDRIRTERYLSPNEARNLALQRVRTRYVVFVDNDVIVTPGWLGALVACAEETGAAVVGPLYFIGPPGDERIHMAGGEARIEVREDGRHLRERHCHQNLRLAECPEALVRRECELVEFHTMLVRTSVFEKTGPLDEGLLSSREHIDFCLRVRELGEHVWFEPGSRLTYVPPPPFAWSDVPYYMLRWSDGWGEATMRHFNAKWELADDPTRLLRNWVRKHRRVVFRPLQEQGERVLGTKRARALTERLAGPVERAVIARALRKGRPAGPPPA